MAKKGAKQAVLETDTLTLDYTLAELSSSQHRSGLAGLVLMVRWLHRFEHWKQDGSAICEIDDNLSDCGATLRINQLGLQALLNEVYAASWEEQERAQVLKNSRTKEVIPYLREEEKNEVDKKGNPIKKKVYIYQSVVPKGAFIADADPEGDRGRWIKLWRDMLWRTLRGVATTRTPYESRANGNYTEDADKIWKELLQPAEFTVNLPSTYYLGAQASNPENVPFKDRARYQFLLHFWVFAASIYVPAVIDNEGNREFVGYAIAIPDISQLKTFCDEFPQLLQGRGNEVTGYRPREAVVDLAVEGALDVIRRLRDRVSRLETGIGDIVLGVDVIHADKQGNNVRILGTTRLDPPEQEWIDKYREIRESLWSAIFRRQRLLNHVSRKPWYTGFDSLLCTIPYEQTMENDYFRHDSRESFKYEVGDMTEETLEIPEESDLPEYSRQKLILRLVRTYVTRKLNTKHGLEWKSEWTTLRKTKEGREKLDKLRDYQEFNEKKAKIAKSAFLDIRSRTETSEFINYFACTICSVPQYIKEEHFVQLTQDLYEKTDEVRTITLLALSANS
ncbi:type I-MYXAN CRISPR-associated protein Cmx8 [Microcoleus sp.]|uniref:type I-MYXAN CRISPR-associated protein Cmx8 n=1 Tax=Microcoleus sp. TaxID=44472 RepID=UPI003523E638